MVSGIEKSSGDTLTFFINHWPSRFGGKKKSDAGRLLASKVLSEQIDSIQKKVPSSKIISMGDYNDSPKDSSIKTLTQNCNLFNPIDSLVKNKKSGTLKFKKNWETYDQILISSSLVTPFWKDKKNLQFISIKIHRENWMLEPDLKNGGEKPFRTYNGPIYTGGFSDHLPVLLTLVIKTQ